MHKLLFFTFFLCCIALLSINVAAQNCGPDSATPFCSNGACCSVNNFCGNSPRYCGTGCQPLYGYCSGSNPSAVSASASTSASTVSATETSSSFSSQSPTVSFTTFTPTTISVTTITTTIIATTTTTTTTTTTDEPSPSPSSTGTFQFQPTGKPSGATSSQEKVAKSTVALVVVFFAGLIMI